jgi:hypothetical protein
MKRRTKAPRGYSARRISLIDSGPQLSRQLLGCIPAHRPIYIQHGLHKTIGIPLVRCTLALPIPTRRVGIVLEYDNNHTYSIVHARKRHLSHRDRSTRCSQFPIFNCKPFQLNTCLYRQSLRFSFVFSPLQHHVFRRITRCVHRTRYVLSRMRRYQQCSSSDCWLDPTPKTVYKHAPLVSCRTESAPLHPPGTRIHMRNSLASNSPLFPAPALSINRLRADLGTHHVGLPLSPHHAL